MKKASTKKAAPKVAATVAAKKPRRPFTYPINPAKPVANGSAAPHKHARRLPEIPRASELEYPIIYRNTNKHPRNGKACKESPLVAAPENMIAIVFEDKTRLVVLSKFVQPREAE